MNIEDCAGREVEYGGRLWVVAEHTGQGWLLRDAEGGKATITLREKTLEVLLGTLCQ